MADDALSREERLQRLAARRATTGPRAVPAPVATEAAPPPRRRRRHAAPTGRVIASGLAASAFFVGIASLAAQQEAWLPTASTGTTVPLATVPAPTAPPPPTAPPTTIVIQEVHHTIYVDPAGNPIDPAASAPSAAAPSPSPRSGSTHTSRAATPAAAAPAPTAAAPAPAPVAAPTPKPAPPPAPTCSGSKCP